MKQVVNFNISNNNTNISIQSNSCVKSIDKVHNSNVIHCIGNYVKVGDVATLKPKVKGSKASDTFYAAIASLEKSFNVKADFINGAYIGIILSAKLKPVR